MDNELDFLYGQIPMEENFEEEESEEFDDSYYDFIQSMVSPKPLEEADVMPWEEENIPFEDIFYDFCHQKYYPDEGFVYINTTEKKQPDGSFQYEVVYYSCGDFTENIYTILNGKLEYSDISKDSAVVRATAEILERLPRQVNLEIYTDVPALIDKVEKIKELSISDETSLEPDYKDLLKAMYCSNITFLENPTADAFESWEKCLDYMQEREEND